MGSVEVSLLGPQSVSESELQDVEPDRADQIRDPDTVGKTMIFECIGNCGKTLELPANGLSLGYTLHAICEECIPKKYPGSQVCLTPGLPEGAGEWAILSDLFVQSAKEPS